MKRGHRLSPQIIWLVFGCMVCQMGAGFFYASRALAPDVIADLGWTRTMWSTGMAPMLFVSSIGQAFVGAACIRFGVRPVVVASSLCLIAAFGVLTTMHSYAQFYVAMMLLALGNAGIGDVSIGGVITRWFERGRGIALGFAFVGSNIGAVIFVHAIASAATWTSWRQATFAVALGGGLLILPFAFFVVRDPRPGEGLLAAVADDPQEDVVATASAASLTLRAAIRQPAFWIFFHTIFCYALVQLGMIDHLILYLTDLGYSKVEAAGALELTVGAGIVSKLSAGVIAQRFSAKRVLVINTVVLTVSLALVPFASDPRILTIFGLLFGVSVAARDVLVPLFVAEIFGARYFAQIFGALMIAFFPGGGLGPLALARVHDVLGSYRPGFAACVVLLATAAIGLAFVRSEREPISV
jgi:MFS family permease